MSDIIERMEHAAYAWEHGLTVCGDYMPSPTMMREAKLEIEALRKDKDAAVAAERAWRDAVDEMLTVAHMAASDDPRESINRLINWHVAVALDPAVSSDAAALVAAERERCAKLCEEVALNTTFHRFSRKAARMCAESIRNSSL